MASRNANHAGEAKVTLRKSRRVCILLLKSVSPGCRLLLEIARPFEEVEQIPPLAPGEAQNVNGPDVFGLHPGVSFHAPLKIFAAPGSQARAARRIPQKSYGGDHMNPLAKYRGSESADQIKKVPVHRLRRTSPRFRAAMRRFAACACPHIRCPPTGKLRKS